jgi:type IV secretion system protein VirD4
MLPWAGLSWVTILVYVALGLVCIGVGLGLLFAALYGGLRVTFLLPHLCQRLWAWLRGRPATTFGSARFASRQDIEAAGLSQPGGVVLGTWDGQTLYNHDPRHTLLLGTSGCWKSTSVMMPTARGWAGSLVALDVKEELWNDGQEARAALGPTHRFNPTDEDSCGINPLDSIRWGTSKQTGDCQRLAMSVYEPDEWSQREGQHWTMTAEAFFVGLVTDAHLRGEAHLGSIYAWLTNPDTSMDDKLKAMLRSPAELVRRAGRVMSDRGPAERSAVWSSTLAALSLWDDPLVVQHTRTSTLSWLTLQDEIRPISLYLCLPVADMQRLRPLTRMILEALLARVTDRGTSPPTHELLLLLDEVKQLGHAAQLESALAYLRGFHCRVVMAWQDSEQAFRYYGEQTSMLAACSTWWVSAPNSPKTAELIERKLGTSTEVRRTVAVNSSVFGFLRSRTESEQHSPRSLLTTGEILTLPKHDVLICREAEPPIRAVKYGAVVPPQPATPQRRVVYAGLAACFVLGLVGWVWVLRPTPTTPPALSVPTMTQSTLLPMPVTGTTSPETRRLEIRLDYQNLPAHLELVDAPRVITGEFIGTPVAFDAEVVMPLDMSHTRAGSNYVMLLPKQLVLPDGLSMPQSAMVGNNPQLRPAMLTLTAAYREDAPRPYALVEFKSKKVLSRHVEAADCTKAHMAAVATTKAVLQCLRQP